MNTCSGCYLERQKNEWKAEKLNTARAEAKKQAIENAETMAITKQGCEYIIIPCSSLAAGAAVVEYVSKY